MQKALEILAVGVNWFYRIISGVSIVFIICLLAYVVSPSVQKFVDGTWQAVSGKVRTTWFDFEQVVDTPSVAERIAMEQVRIKKACDRGDQKACQYLGAVEWVGR
jgi:hypothetical protein